MAHEVHNVTITVHQQTQYSRYLQLIAAVKSVAVTVKEDPSVRRDHLVMSDRQIKISGFWPALEYILERYPGDNIQAGWSLDHRAVQRSLTHDLLAMDKIEGIFLTTLQRWFNGTPNGFIIEAGTPSLVDVAYLAVGHETPESKAPIAALRGVFNQYIQSAKAAYAA